VSYVIASHQKWLRQQRIGAYRIGAQHSQCSGGPTTRIVAAAADEVSAASAAGFSSHARDFHELSSRAAAFHAEFAGAVNSAGSAYAAAEAANVSPLAAVVSGAQSLAVSSPVAAATGRPLVGNGANGAVGTGQAGGDGGWLYGNGGKAGPVCRVAPAAGAGRPV
jgi:hypothetical protein